MYYIESFFLLEFLKSYFVSESKSCQIWFGHNVDDIQQNSNILKKKGIIIVMIVTARFSGVVGAVRQVPDSPRIGHGGRERNLWLLPFDATLRLRVMGIMGIPRAPMPPRATFDFWQRSRNAPWNPQRVFVVISSRMWRRKTLAVITTKL